MKPLLIKKNSFENDPQLKKVQVNTVIRRTQQEELEVFLF